MPPPKSLVKGGPGLIVKEVRPVGQIDEAGNGAAGFVDAPIVSMANKFFEVRSPEFDDRGRG